MTTTKTKQKQKGTHHCHGELDLTFLPTKNTLKSISRGIKTPKKILKDAKTYKKQGRLVFPHI